MQVLNSRSMELPTWAEKLCRKRYRLKRHKKARQGQIKKWTILVVNLIMFAVCLQTNPVFVWECSMLFCSNGMKDLNNLFFTEA